MFSNNNLIRIVVIGLTALSILFYSCRKKEIFGQDGTIYGTLLYENILVDSPSPDTVRRSVEVRIVKDNDPDEVVYENVLSPGKGEYELKFLREGKLNIQFTLKYPTTDGGEVVYTHQEEMEVEKDSRIEWNPVLTVEEDEKRLLFSVRENVSQQLIDKAEICLFTDSSFLDFEAASCTGIKMASTNKWGKAVFTSLDPVSTYYFIIKGTFNGQSHTNKATTRSTGTALSSVSQPFPVEIRRGSETPKPCLKIFARDANGHFLKDAKICLFVNEQAMNSNANTCQGSLRIDSTGSDGSLVFTDLNPQDYFFYATLQLGNLKLVTAEKGRKMGEAKTTCTTDTFHVVLEEELPEEKPCLRLLTVDESGTIPLPNVDVCLFVNEQAYLSNLGSCTGYLQKDTSGPDGIVVFEGLNLQDYYFHATTTIGNLKLSNAGTVFKGTAVVGCPNPVMVELKEEVPPPALPCLAIRTVDSLGNLLPEAEVCLFVNEQAYQSNLGSCTGALSPSKTTDDQGEVFFDSLNDQVYYIHAKITLGVLELDNTMTQDTASSSPSCQTMIREIVLK